MTKNEILEAVSQMIDNNTTENKLTLNDFNDKICLRESINTILKSSKNESLNSFCNEYISKLNNGMTDSMLVEAFISGVSNWNYLSAVDTQLSALSDRVDKYRQEIDFHKIINTMKVSESYYLVPLIEDLVLDYVNDKTATKRAVLKNRLQCYEFDPFIAEMLQAISLDRSIKESVNIAKANINSNIAIETPYSPVQYIKENECLFNIDGTYYIRKNNTISRVNKSEVSSINENFRNLCNIVNTKVAINEASEISFADENNFCKINNSGIFVNNTLHNLKELHEASRIAYFSGQNPAIFEMAEYLYKHYDDIAEINFAKHIYFKNNPNHSVDIMKIKESLFITTHDTTGKHTFYKNVNPIQASNIINEHMNTNISSIFEDLQPEDKKVQSEIEETKKSYESYIKELEDRKVQLESCKEGCSESDAKDVDEALKLVEDELEKAKNDYKDYQDTADDFMNAKNGEDDNDYYTDDSQDSNGDNSDDFGSTQDDQQLDNKDVETPLTQEDENVPEYDGLFDEEVRTEEDEHQPKVVKISYATNLKTGEVTNSGFAYVLIPSVNSNGDVEDEFQKISFMLDAEGNPVINNEYMPISIYNIIKTAIENDPVTPTIDVNKSADTDLAEPELVAAISSDPDTANENPIDVAYGTTELDDETPAEDENPDGEVNIDLTNVDDDMPAEDDELDMENIDDVEPAATDDPAPEDLEAASDNYASKISVDFSDFDAEGVNYKHFVNYLTRKGLYANVLQDELAIEFIVRNAEEFAVVKHYLMDYCDWSDKDVFDFFEEFRMYENYKVSENLVVKYNQKLRNLLESNNVAYKVSKYGDKIMIMNAINEGVLITVEDQNSGKTVVINTDELSKADETEDREKNTQDDVTFSDDNAEETKTEDESNEDNNENSEDNSDEKNESAEPSHKPSKFMFRVKKKNTNESLGITEYDSLNENVEDPAVMDEIKYKGKSGNIISRLSNGDIIINVEGKTEQVRPSAVRITSKQKVKPIVESVNTPSDEISYCGIYMNNFRLTPSNCIINTQEFNNATAEDIVNVIVEGVKSPVAKKYVKLNS